MAQRLFQSFRRLPGQFTGFQRKNDSLEVQGAKYKINNQRLITLTDSDDLHLWEIVSSGSSSYLTEVSHLESVTQHLWNQNGTASSEETPTEQSHVTALCCASDNRHILIGTDHGWVASIRLDLFSKPEDKKIWSAPSAEDAINPTRILSSVASDRRQRLRVDAVVVLTERPGFPGQLLIGYSSGLSLIFDLLGDRILALLPWQHGLETATWCGGSGFSSSKPNDSSISSSQLGTRLLTAHSDGSLGVWNLKKLNPSSSQPVSLSMEEAPSMPYGPFPCKLISKVFWLPSKTGGITAFAGGMPRATYGERHTVSLLRGSNLDRAAAANVAAARIAAAAEAEEDDETLDEIPISEAPIHVFDSDAPEHVCFDLPSALVDLLPIGPQGGAAQILLLLCEEELIVIDLITPGWPFLRPPYMTCLHTSAITTYSLFTQVNSTFLNRLESAGVHYGPEGRFGRGSTIASAGWSTLPWPIQGGQALVSGSRLSSSLTGVGGLFTDDLLLTGHEDGSVTFWRLSAGGCLRRIYTLQTAVLFEGEFGLLDGKNGVDDDVDAWPPFRQAGVFDPFVDDSRAAVQLIRLMDNTVVIGGAAGQITVWEFMDFSPPLSPAYVPIKTEIPGFQWKGHAPLTMRSCYSKGETPGTESGPPQLQATGIVLVQPPARITSLLFMELNNHQTIGTRSQQTPNALSGSNIILAFGTPHGFGSVFIPAPNLPTSDGDAPTVWKPVEPQTLLAVSTLPDNLSALQEAAAGEGWARRRTRELKKSLRDSFRRLKRMRSTKSSTNTTVVSAPPAVSRTGLRRTVTQSNRTVARPTNSDPLEEAERRSGLLGDPNAQYENHISIEREIRDRPLDSASVAVVSCLIFAPPLFRLSHSSSTPHEYSVGSLFVGTKAGVVKAHAIIADRDPKSSQGPPKLRIILCKELTLYHRAPILTLRIVNSKNYNPIATSSLETPNRTLSKSHNLPLLMVSSEEQVRLFSLPGLHLKHKARITANDGYRIKAASLVGFKLTNKSDGNTNPGASDKQATSSEQLYDYSLVFTNMGGQAVVLSMPQLRRKDTLCLINSKDVVAINSVTFAETGSSDSDRSNFVDAPALGVYQLAPGQLSLFDVVKSGQRSSYLGASYSAIYRLNPSSSSRTAAVAAMEIRSNSKQLNGTSDLSKLTSNNGLLVENRIRQTTDHIASLSISQASTSLGSHSRGDSHISS